jgi:hypothetical protein
MPWRRAQQGVLLGRVDGFFTAMLDPSIDPFATLTVPLLLEKWYWFSRSGTSDNTAAKPQRAGVILGSPQQLWYELNGYTSILPAQSLPQLIKLLLAGRIDVVLADRQAFIEAAQALGVPPQEYRQRFFRYVPLGVYMGKQFIADNPDFMSRFNRQVPHCAPEGFALSEYEQALVRQGIGPLLERWLQTPELVQWLAHYNQAREDLTEPQILALDQQWRSDYQKGNHPGLNALLSPKLMALLERWLANDTHDYITEIIITGRRGMNVAAKPYSSDFWQGDEAKFQQGVVQTNGHWFFDKVLYDSSSQHFQAQISVPIRANAEVVGVITLGVAIERIIQSVKPQ